MTIATQNNTATVAATIAPANDALFAPGLDKKEAKKLARAYLKGLLNQKLSANATEAARQWSAMQDAVRGAFGVTAKATGERDAVARYFAEHDKADELELFKLFKLGRAEMRKKARGLIRNVAPEKRIWIAFEDEAWIVKARGEQAPAGWNGVMPK